MGRWRMLRAFLWNVNGSWFGGVVVGTPVLLSIILLNPFGENYNTSIKVFKWTMFYFRERYSRDLYKIVVYINTKQRIGEASAVKDGEYLCFDLCFPMVNWRFWKCFWRWTNWLIRLNVSFTWGFRNFMKINRNIILIFYRKMTNHFLEFFSILSRGTVLSGLKLSRKFQ